jgi:hypothetical protein
VQVGPVALEIQHRVEHQLAGGMVGHLAAAVDAEQGQGRIGGIEAQVLRAGAAAQGVARLMLEQQHRLQRLRFG